MVVFTLGSVACALSASAADLIAARALQGVGGAVMSALALSILSGTYSRRPGPARLGSGRPWPVSAWTTQVAYLPGAARQTAIGQARNVASARIGPATRALGTSYRAAAEQAFSHGYQVAVLIAGLGLIAAAILAAFVLRDNRRPELDAAADKPAPGDPDNLTIAGRPYRTFVTRPDGEHNHVNH
jgi:MFS family permease